MKKFGNYSFLVFYSQGNFQMNDTNYPWTSAEMWKKLIEIIESDLHIHNTLQMCFTGEGTSDNQGLLIFIW